MHLTTVVGSTALALLHENEHNGKEVKSQAAAFFECFARASRDFFNVTELASRTVFHSHSFHGGYALKITQAQNDAAGELVELIASQLGNGRAIHPETAISTSARLAGSLLFRSFNLDFAHAEPGTVVLSEQANEKGPMLVNTLMAYLSAMNVALDEQRLHGDAASRGAPPQLDILLGLSRLQQEAIAIGERHKLSLDQTAQAAALATGFVIRECAKNISAETGFNVAVYGFIEGSKTVPPQIADAPRTPSAEKPWYKFWH
jgi:hypothetical protein